MHAKPPIKVAIIRKNYTPFGGAERIIDLTIDTLNKQGTDITLITRKWSDAPHCHVHTCNSRSFTRTGKERAFSQAVLTHIQNTHYDLVQSHERIPGCDIYRAGDGLHHSWLEQRKRVLTPLQRFALDASPFHRYMLKTETALFSASNLKAVICISQMIKEDIQQRFNVPEEKLHVIYNGVDTERFHPRLKTVHRNQIRTQYNIPDQAHLMLYVGSGFERKGVPALIQAMQGMPANCHLLIVGKDKKQAHYRKQVEVLGLAQQIHFAGPQKDVAPYYGAADVFVMPALYEPFGNVVLEAMASGLPVITSIQCGASDLIKNSINGFTCDALDINAIHQHMKALCCRQTQQTMGEAARNTAEPFTLERMGEAMLSLYQQLLSQTAGNVTHAHG